MGQLNTVYLQYSRNYDLQIYELLIVTNIFPYHAIFEAHPTVEF